MEHGTLMSTGFQTYLKQNPCKAILSEASADQAFKNLLANHSLTFGQVQDWVKAVVKGLITGNTATIQSVPAQKQKIPGAAVPNLIERLQRIAKAVQNHQNKGIVYHVDKIMGTDKHIFSIVGPHNECGYGDIIFVLRPEIMHHPGNE